MKLKKEISLGRRDKYIGIISQGEHWSKKQTTKRKLSFLSGA